MKYQVLLIMLLFAVTAYSGELIKDKPEKVREFENFRIKLNHLKDFTIDINMDCLKIQRMGNIKKNGDSYISNGGIIYFENGCFAGENLEITIKSGDKSERINLRLSPAIAEERDYGC